MTIELKFAPGETVWTMHENKVRKTYITTVYPGVRGINTSTRDEYSVNADGLNKRTEEQLFTSKQELLDSL